MNAETEVRALIRAGKRKEAIARYERELQVVFKVGDNRGIPRLRAWYGLAIADDPRAA